MIRQYEDLDELLNEGKTEETRDVTSIVEGLIDQYGVNTAANILKSELNEDTDLNTELKVANEDGETDAQPADNQQNNNNQNDQQQQNNVQQQSQISEETIKEFDEVYNKCSEFLNKYAKEESIKGGRGEVRKVMDLFKNGLRDVLNKQKGNQQDNNQQQNNQNNQQNQQQNNQQNNQNNSGQQ